MELLKKNFKYFKYLITIICLYIVYVNLIDAKEDLNEIKFNKNFLVLLFLFLILNSFNYNLILFKLIKNTNKSSLKLLNWFYIYYNSQFLNQIPFFGFVYRAVKLKKYSISYENYISIYFFLFWFIFFISLLFFSFEVAIIVSPFISLFNIPIPIILFISSLLLFCGPFIFHAIIKKYEINYKFINRLKFYILNIFKYSIITIKNKKFTLFFFLLVFSLHVLSFITFYLAVKTLGLGINIQIILILWISKVLIDFFPITPNNIAITEIIIAITGMHFGLSFTAGVLINILLRIINLLINLFFTLFFNIYNFFSKFE